MRPGGAFLPPSAETADAPDLFSAVELQLGLRLAEKKVSRDVLVIDSIDKIPAGN